MEYILSSVDAVWLGVKIGVGIVLGLGLTFLAWRYLPAYWELWRFMGSGCTYQSGGGPGVPRGWLTRDVNNDDWILWDEDSRVVLRCNDDDAKGVPWRVSNESLNDFLILAHKYKKYINI